MVATQTLRTDYTAPFIRGFVTSGDDYGKPIADYTGAAEVVFLAGGPSYPNGRVTLKVHPLAAPVFVALAAVFHHHGYTFDETAGGTINPRNITGAKASTIDRQVELQIALATSLHAHGIALDINPSRNRYRISSGLIQWGPQTDLPKALIADVEAILNRNGKRALEWGGRWWNTKDPMHFELDLTLLELEAGIDSTTVTGLDAYLEWAANPDAPNPTPNPTEDQMLDTNSPRPSKAVADYQRDLIELGYDLGDWPALTTEHPPGADGKFGGDTGSATSTFQTAQNLQATGKGDALTVGQAAALAARARGGPALDDVYTKNESDARYARRNHPHTIT